MKHVRIATYEIKKGSFQELADVAQDEMLREFRDQPRFIRYGLADIGEKQCLSLSLWRPARTRSMRSPSRRPGIVSTSATGSSCRTSQVGDLAFYEGVPARSDRPSGTEPTRPRTARARS